MILCEEPRLDTWSAPPQPEFGSYRPRWTKLSTGGVQLSNAIEAIDWEERIVYPTACEGCWSSHCAATDIARIVRLGKLVLWLKPADEYIWEEWWVEVFENGWRSRLSPANVLFPESTWSRLTQRFPSLRPFADLRPATNRDLIHLWFEEAPAALRTDRTRVRQDTGDWLTEALLQSGLAADPIELPLAANRLGRLLDSLLATADEPAAGRLVPVAEAAGDVESIFLDGDPFTEWPAATFDPDALIFDAQWSWTRDASQRLTS